MQNESEKLSFFLNLGFSFFELIGGLLTNSMAILSDAIHDLGDSISIAVSSVLEDKATKKSDKEYTFGYKRYSILGTLLIAVIMIISSLIVLLAATIRLFVPAKLNLIGMFLFAIFGFAINCYAVYKTSRNINSSEKSFNMPVLLDVFGWILVLICILAIKLTNWVFLDPLLSILIAILTIYKSVKNIFGVVDIILEKTPSSIDIDLIHDEIVKFKLVEDVLEIHVWSLDSNEILLTMHVLVSKNITKKNFETVKKDIKDYLVEKGISHSTIEIEYGC